MEEFNGVSDHFPFKLLRCGNMIPKLETDLDKVYEGLRS